MNNEELIQRETWIDVLRSIACICVLLVHSPIPFDGETGGSYLLAPFNYLFMSCGVYVFFMISGSLLFQKEQKMSIFYKKRFSRVVSPLLFWSIVYILLGAIRTKKNITEIIIQIAMIPFTSQIGIMWFMYVLCGIYLLTPILSSWLSKATKREVEVLLVLWLATTTVPYLKIVSSEFARLIDCTGLLYSFSGFVGYAVLGFYLRKYHPFRVKSIKFLVLVACGLGLPMLVYILPFIPKMALDGPVNIASVSLATSAFIFFQQLKLKDYVEHFLVSVAKYSFGIYLCHMLFMEPMKHLLSFYHLHYAIQIPLTATVVGCVSYAFVNVLSKLKYSRYIIG